MKTSGSLVRAMRRDDIPAADALRRMAGWNQTWRDWERFLECEPDGCFVAESEGGAIGTAITIAYGQDLGWVGMMLVHPDYRRRGVGSMLLGCALRHLEDRGVRCVKLDATPAGQPVYERFDFQPELHLNRWQRGDLEQSLNAPVSPSLPWPAADLDLAARLDQRAFGFNRERLLTLLATQAYRRAVEREAGPDHSDHGIGLLRAGSRAYYLGPVLATSRGLAATLIERLLAGLSDQPVFWDILEANSAAETMAAALGFTIQRPLLRMYRGPALRAGAPELQYGIVDPAVG